MSEQLSEWMRGITQSGASIGRHDMDKCVVISEDVIDLVAALEAKLSKIVAECENPNNRGRMTQKQQAAFLDRLRSEALAGEANDR